jgi:hypothetical protein
MNMRYLGIALALPLLMSQTGCKTSNASQALDTPAGPSASGPGSFHCRFDILGGEISSFEISGVLAGGQLQNVRGRTTADQGPGEEKTKDVAPLAAPEKLTFLYDKPPEQRRMEDRNVRVYEKGVTSIDPALYACYDVSGVGPGRVEDYFCVNKQVPLGAGQALWVSDFHFAKDLNVMSIQGSSCRN